MEPVSADFLSSIDSLKDVPKDQLQWLIDNSRQYIVPAGEFLFKPGDPVKGTHVLISGRIRIYAVQGNSTREIDIWEGGEIGGYLPYSRGKVAGAYGVAMDDVELMTFPIDRIRELINQHFELTQALVHEMTDRVREFTALQQQNEKMMALGKLSAGLAHELNNPAAAIVRSSTLLKQHLRLQPETFKDVISIRMSGEQVDIVNNILFALMDRGKPVMPLMERTGKEDEMTDWLDDSKVSNAQEIAENFVEFGFTLADLDDFRSRIPAEHLSPVFNWINNNLVTEKMVSDIQDASQRISDLVGSVKNFTHMDRGQDKQYSDIHTGIRNTITMLNHKLRKGNIEMKEDFDLGLPQVKALIGELNQVWTNLIDNAVDAMEPNGKGVLEIRTRKDGEFVRVSVIDNGPGIPEDVRSKIFDPFFTTKDIGKGTGLGLDVVNKIVRQHNGSIKVDSVPGRTEFVICFPING